MARQNRSARPDRDLYQEITNKVLAQLEAGTRPWIKPWSAPGSVDGVSLGLPLPRRVTGDAYRGINVILLWMTAAERGYTNPTWMTFEQAKKLGGGVRKGESGTMVVFYKRFVKKVLTESGEQEETIPVMRSFPVFNVEQIDRLPERFQVAEKPAPALPSPDGRIEHVEAFYGSLSMALAHGGDLAYYSPALDRVQMPHFSAFAEPVRYYDTLGHESVHWSGAKHRLDRTFGKRFGDTDYAAEELVAELGAAFLAASLGIASEPRPDHADYLASWLKKLRDDKKFIVQAASQAAKAVDFLQGLAGDKAEPEGEEEAGEEIAQAA